MDKYIIFKQNYKDITYERTGYLYKRITHFRKHVRDLWKKLPFETRLDSIIEQMELMFNGIQSPFLKYKPKSRGEKKSINTVQNEIIDLNS